ncbi:hypothetical protein AMTR_s00057p00059280 [Amborella trichopoda]|uniref:Uncharacterized protein n=1 Tax=Amborella trichopoda TaxID=13333 RepID=U5D3F2_AMBTC|nr:hypothetical protein AMTR_s00057p00059280 [Amborella trichopoda]
MSIRITNSNHQFPQRQLLRLFDCHCKKQLIMWRWIRAEIEVVQPENAGQQGAAILKMEVEELVLSLSTHHHADGFNEGNASAIAQGEAVVGVLERETMKEFQEFNMDVYWRMTFECEI